MGTRSIHLDVGCLHEAGDFCLLRAQVNRYLVQRGQERIHALAVQGVEHLGIRQHLADLLMEPLHDRARGGRRRVERGTHRGNHGCLGGDVAQELERWQ